MSFSSFGARRLIRGYFSLLLVLVVFCSSEASATEGGGTGVYPDGIETYFIANMPPPGFYTLVYTGIFDYDRVIGNAGNPLPIPGFKVEVEAIAPRFVWVTQQQILGGQLAWGANTPVVHTMFEANGKKFTDTGVGDISLGPGLGYHLSDKIDVVVATDFFLPTGQYSKTDPASISKNYYVVQPILAISYNERVGQYADIKMMYDFNMRNNATSTTSGEAAHADFDAGWGFSNGFALGAGGHIFEQVTPDRGPNSAAGKSRAIALGPSTRYWNGKNFLVAATIEREFAVKNRPQGTQLFVKVGIPFD
jgi:hypothetical protein